jgi:DNA-binding winged helix-turn-helix (wHTH) protein/tetratricopeptide (TPR) repeat protein
MRLRFRDLLLDTSAFELTRGGEPVHLEPQAFEVLTYLVDHADRVVSRDELLESVWGSVYVSDSALATRIKEARRALGDDGTEQWAIRTIHRRGYRFVAPFAIDGDVDVPRPEAGSVDPAPVPITAPGRPPVGREAELQVLCNLLQETRQSGTRLAFVSGEAGIGKSTLLAAFRDWAQREPDVLLGRGQCIEGHGASEAYLPLLDAVSQLASGSRGAGVLTVLRQAAPTWVAQIPGLMEGTVDTQGADLTRDRMLREFTSALDLLGATSPVVLVIEDLHWADPSTLDVLDMLARRNSDAQVMMVGSIRTGDAASGNHPVHRLSADLTVRGHAAGLSLGPLGEEAIRAIVRERAPESEREPALATSVTERSGGNPLFAKTLLLHWERADDGVGSEELPETLRLLVSRQLEYIPAEDRQLIEAAAIAGDTLTPTVVAAISGHEAGLVEEVMNAFAGRGHFLRRRGVFEWPSGELEEEYAFTHSLIREVTLGTLPLGRRARMHRAAGEVLAERLGAQAHHQIDEIAMHFVQGGDAERAVPALIQSAQRARSRSAQREAKQALEQALHLVSRIPDEATRIRLEIAAQTLLGAVLVALDGWAAPSIQSAYERALALASSTSDPALIGDILAGLATTHEFRGEYEEAQRLMTERIALVPQGGPARAESHELLACSLFHQGRLRQSVQEADVGITLADGADAYQTAFGEHPGVACRMWKAQSQWFLGEVRQAHQAVDEALQSPQDELSLLDIHYHAAMLGQYAGDTERVRHHAREMFALTQSLGFESYEILSGLLRAWVEAVDGYEPALPLLQRAIDAYRESGMRMDLPYALTVQADALLARGHADEAARAMEDAFSVRSEGRGYVYEPEMWRLHARVALASGEREEAAERLRRAVAVARAQEAGTSELRALADLADLGDRTPEVLRRLETLVDALAADGEPGDVARARSLLAAAD